MIVGDIGKFDIPQSYMPLVNSGFNFYFFTTKSGQLPFRNPTTDKVKCLQEAESNTAPCIVYDVDKKIIFVKSYLEARADRDVNVKKLLDKAIRGEA